MTHPTISAADHTAAGVLGLHVCSTCGTVESLAAVIQDMVRDDEILLLIRTVLHVSLPLGAQVARYLELHVPPKQRLRPTAVRAVLADVARDLQRGAITYKGAEISAPADLWSAAFGVLFSQAADGRLKLPLSGNGYLYSVLANKAQDRAEAAVDSERRQRSSRPTDDVIAGMDQALSRATDAISRLSESSANPAAAAALRARFNRPSPGTNQGE